MLAGPGLLVILAIALVVFGPKKLPELAKTIGKAVGEFKKTTQEMKESIGLQELGGMRSNLTGIDFFVDLAEKVSASMTPAVERERPQTHAEDSKTSIIHGDRMPDDAPGSGGFGQSKETENRNENRK